MSEPDFAAHLVTTLLLALEDYPGIRETLHSMPGVLQRELHHDLERIVNYELDVNERR